MDSDYVMGFKYVRVVNTPGLSICQGFELQWLQGFTYFGSKTVLWICVGMLLWKGSEYYRIPNMPGFCIWKHYTRFWIWLNNTWVNCSDYGRDLNIPAQIFTGFLNMLLFLNMVGLEVWQGCELEGLHRVLYMPE